MALDAHSAAEVLADLQHAGHLDLGDFLAFVAEPDRNHPTIEGYGMVYDGLRFRVQGQLAGKAHGMPFGLDVGFGDVLTEPPEMIDGATSSTSWACKPTLRGPRAIKLTMQGSAVSSLETLPSRDLPAPHICTWRKSLPYRHHFLFLA
jgi:hypothetical protein